jgi:hypothetical protein
LPHELPAPTVPVEDVPALAEALDYVAVRDSNAAELVKLHGFDRIPEVAQARMSVNTSPETSVSRKSRPE